LEVRTLEDGVERVRFENGPESKGWVSRRAKNGQDILVPVGGGGGGAQEVSN